MFSSIHLFERGIVENMDNHIEDIVFLLLGNSPTLPYSECASILESNNIPFKEIGRLDQVLIVSAPVEACQVVARQAGMVRRSCILLSRSPKNPKDMLKAIADLDLREIVGPLMSFAVRVKGIRDHSKGLDTNVLEREIGGQIKNKLKWATVNLENPDYLFYAIITGDEALFCINVEQVEESGFDKRRPGSRPFFHPSSMHPRLARVMVNLSGAKPRSRFLDPFCGSGGILVEAGVVGCELIGVDIDSRMCKGSRRNLSALDLQYVNICTADARHIPLREVDSIATDPPYGRSSSTKGGETALLVEDSLEQIASILKSHCRVCISVPSTVDINQFRLKGLELSEVHHFRVHRSLTRNIVVFVKK